MLARTPELVLDWDWMWPLEGPHPALPAEKPT